VFLNAVRYAGTAVVEEVAIDVFMRSVTTDEVAEHYERWLVEEDLAYDESSQGTFGWRFSDAYLVHNQPTSRGICVVFRPGVLVVREVGAV
jgi:hypothetical protein